MNTRTRKYDYLLILQGDYGQGWEDLTAEDKHGPAGSVVGDDGAFSYSSPYKRIRQTLREYRENEGGTYRIIERRELKETAA